MNPRSTAVVGIITLVLSGCSKCASSKDKITLIDPDETFIITKKISPSYSTHHRADDGLIFGLPGKLEVTPSGSATESLEFLFDNDPGTAWLSSDGNYGSDLTLSASFEQPSTIFGLSYIPGYAKNYELLRKFAIPSIDINIQGIQEEYRFQPCSTLFETDIAWSDELEDDFEEPFKIASDRHENMSLRFAIFPKPIKVTQVTITVADTLSQIGVEPNIAISELSLVTEANHLTTNGVKLYQYLRDLDNQSTLETLTIRLPTSEMECSKHSIYAAATNHKVTTKDGIYLRDLTAKHLTSMISSYISTNDNLCNNDANEFIYVDNEIEQMIIFADWPDGTISSSCWSDGEGGTQFVLGVAFQGDHPIAFEVIARLDQRP